MFPRPIQHRSQPAQWLYAIALPIALILWLFPLIGVAITSVRPAADLAAGDELDQRVVGVQHVVASHFEVQPAHGRVEHRRLGGPRPRVPGVAQVVAQAQHVSAVARPHQGFGARRLQVQRAGVPAPAAGRVGQGGAAGAGGVGGARAHGEAGIVPSRPA